MSFFQRNPPQTLSEWLEAATRKLAEPAKARIRAEIETHYVEAVARHSENGLSQCSAEAEALAELGDAKTAAKRLRKRHLTTWEDKMVKKSLTEGRSIYSLILGYAAFAGVCYLIAPHLHRGELRGQIPFLAFNFLFLAAFPTAAFILARFGNPNRQARPLLLLTAGRGLLPLVYLMFLLIPILFATGLSFLWCFVIVLIPFIFAICLHLHVWKKLGKVGAVSSEVPPPDAAQA